MPRRLSDRFSQTFSTAILPQSIITTENIANSLPTSAVTTANIADHLPAGILSSGDTVTYLTETVFGFTWGGTLSVNPDQGGIHRYTLNANTTISPLLWDNGQSILLLLNAGAYTVTWPTMTWLNNGGTAPDMAATGYTAISMWKMDNTYYGVLVGNG
jgi:hypothetical protein